MIKICIGGIFGFMIGVGYGIYQTVKPDQGTFTTLVKAISIIKGLLS